MKYLIILSAVFFSLTSKGQSANKTIITTTLSVKGNCEDCKKRIENAADIKGVKFFEWSEKTKIAKVIYDNSKTNLETIEKAIAAKGYETPTQTGDATAYNKLPACCKYKAGECKEKK